MARRGENIYHERTGAGKDALLRDTKVREQYSDMSMEKRTEKRKKN